MTPDFPQPSSLSSSANLLVASQPFDDALTTTEFLFPDGRVLRLPTALLVEHLSPLQQAPAPNPTQAGTGPMTIPIIEEQLQVGKRIVVTGTVRLDKHIGIYEEALDIPLAVRSFDIERIALNQPVETAPSIRQEGETTIYPLVEEQLVLTKQLILREELRVTRRDTERRDTRTVSLKRESIEVTRAS